MPLKLLNKFQEHITNNLTFLKEGKLLIAISGGLDSVVMTHLFKILDFDIHLAHCNFNLRGEESDTDEAFVLELAEDLELEVFIESFDTQNYAEENKLSVQMAARELRYNWFEELAEQLQFDYILTAHHADDNLETFLINVSRGTGLDGLTGIPEINGKIVRPLLPFSRTDILKYAEENAIQWREDSSNASTKYVRNKLRHELIPILKELNPQLLQSFKKTQDHLNDSKSIIEDSIVKIQKKVVSISDNTILLNIDKIQKLSKPKAYLYELLKDFGFTEWDDVNNLLYAQSGKVICSKSHRLIKDRDYLMLSENITVKDESYFSISKDDKKITLSKCTLNLEEVETIGVSNASTIFVDKDLLKYPLMVRKWEKGDYFYPFGMTGKKKLSKFFKDEKWSLPDKEQGLLLFSDDKIVWILNSRMDNRFKVTNDTKTILKIQLTP
jgi:tRNA(Ile)-lysidine synthase